MSGRGLITNCNKATLRKILPTVQTFKLLFGQGMRAGNAEQVGQRTDKAEQVGQRADKTEQLTQQPNLQDSRAAGVGPASHPPVSHPRFAPGVGVASTVGSVKNVEDSLAVTPAPAQAESEHWVKPVLVGNEEGVGNQVDSALLGKRSNVLFVQGDTTESSNRLLGCLVVHIVVQLCALSSIVF